VVKIGICTESPSVLFKCYINIYIQYKRSEYALNEIEFDSLKCIVLMF